MLENLSPQVRVEPIEDRVGVPDRGPVVGEDELHAADDGVQPIGVVHYLRQYGIF
jgi:hypothetical protein